VNKDDHNPPTFYAERSSPPVQRVQPLPTLAACPRRDAFRCIRRTQLIGLGVLACGQLTHSAQCMRKISLQFQTSVIDNKNPISIVSEATSKPIMKY